MIEENSSTNALEALKKGIEFNEQGDLDKAEFLYQEAIKSIEASGSIENFLLETADLIDTQFLSEKITETIANQLLQQIKAAYVSVKNIAEPPCGECKKDGRDGYWIGQKPCQRCVKCSVN